MGQPCSREEGDGPISFLTGTTGKATKSIDDIRDIYRSPESQAREVRQRRRRVKVAQHNSSSNQGHGDVDKNKNWVESDDPNAHVNGDISTQDTKDSYASLMSNGHIQNGIGSLQHSADKRTLTAPGQSLESSVSNSMAVNATSNSATAGATATAATIPTSIGSGHQPSSGRFAPLTKGAWVLGPTEDINIRYELGNEPVGEPGSFGKVVKAKCRDTGVEFACKIIPKIKFALKWDGLAQFKREVKIMKMLRHPNIIQYHDFFEDSLYFYILMELCTGGELIHSEVRGVYSEEDASRFLRQMVSAVAYMHSMKLVHCDLKPDNFLFLSNKPDSPIKLIDFGLSKFIAHRGHFTAATGTPYFIAPEVLVGAYNQSCDLWSLGVVMFIMLFGFPPFDVRREERQADTKAADKKIFQKILRGFDPRVLPGAGAHFPAELPVSDSARDLIARLLTTDSGKRLTAEEALNHPWLQGVTALKTHLDPLVLKAMRTFDMQCKFQQAVLHLMVDWLNDVSLQQLQSTFAALDTNGDGFIGIQDLRTAMKAFYAEQQEREAAEGYNDSDKPESKDGSDSANTTEEMIETEAFWELEVQQIMRRVDINNDGYISYEDLLLSYVSMTLSEKEERMWAAFSKLDVDNSGRVDLEDLMAALNSKGLYDVEEMRVMLNEVDVDEDGMVEFEDFLEIMWQKHRSYLEDQRQRIQQKADRKRAKRQLERAERRGKAAAAAAAAAATASNGESPRPSSIASGAMTPVIGTPSFFSAANFGPGYYALQHGSGAATSVGSTPSRDGSPVPSLSMSGATPMFPIQPHSPMVLNSSTCASTAVGGSQSVGPLRLTRNASGTPTLPASQSNPSLVDSSPIEVQRGVFGIGSREITSIPQNAIDNEDPDVSMPIPFPNLDDLAVEETASKRDHFKVDQSLVQSAGPIAPAPQRLVAVPETRAITPPLVSPSVVTSAVTTGHQATIPTALSNVAPVYVPPVILATATAETMSQKAIHPESSTASGGAMHGHKKRPEQLDVCDKADSKVLQAKGDLTEGKAQDSESLSACVPFPPPMTPVEAAQTLGLNAPVVSASITKSLRDIQFPPNNGKL